LPQEPAARFFARAFSCSILSGTSQPPLPLHEFLAAQPLSPPAQPPSPLHVFWPLQVCRAASEAQPPLPWQSFLPPQPLLPQPCLHEPWPLHWFRPLQTCLGSLDVPMAASRAPARGAPTSPATAAPRSAAKRLRSMSTSCPCPPCRTRSLQPIIGSKEVPADGRAWGRSAPPGPGSNRGVGAGISSVQ